MTHNGCKNGHCSVLMDDEIKCDFRQRGRLNVCNYMNQITGVCMCLSAQRDAAPRRKRRVWDKVNDATYAEEMARKNRVFKMQFADEIEVIND